MTIDDKGRGRSASRSAKRRRRGDQSTDFEAEVRAVLAAGLPQRLAAQLRFGRQIPWCSGGTCASAEGTAFDSRFLGRAKNGR